MSDKSFEVTNKRAWIQAISASMGKAPPRNATWYDVEKICTILDPFMGLNHGLLPGGGGLDFKRIGPSRESGCINLSVDRRAFYVVKPKVLSFEFIGQSPENSFFLLELSKLDPSGIYNNVYNDYEEVVDIDGDYFNRTVWDEGVVGFDNDGREIPLPEHARLVMRLLSGKILFVAATSLWNRDSSTYDGRHNLMDAERIRKIIENALPS